MSAQVVDKVSGGAARWDESLFRSLGLPCVPTEYLRGLDTRAGDLGRVAG
jgi:hypothetical protein